MCDRLDKTWRIKKYQQITYSQVQFNCNLFTQAGNTYWRILLTSFNLSVHSRSNWNLTVLDLDERGKQEYPKKNFSGLEGEPVTVNDKLNLSTPRFDHLPRWREKSVVTNAPLLLPSPVS